MIRILRAVPVRLCSIATRSDDTSLAPTVHLSSSDNTIRISNTCHVESCIFFEDLPSLISFSSVLNAINIVSEHTNGRAKLRDLGINGRIIFKRILNRKREVVNWIQVAQYSIQKWSFVSITIYLRVS